MKAKHLLTKQFWPLCGSGEREVVQYTYPNSGSPPLVVGQNGIYLSAAHARTPIENM